METNLCAHLKRKSLGEKYSKKEELAFIYHYIGHLAMIESWILEKMSVPEEEPADSMTNCVTLRKAT